MSIIKHNALIKLLFIAAASLFIASCATSPVQPAPQNQSTAWGERVQALSKIQTWDLKGLIAIRTSRDAWTADWHWQQTHDNYSISLFGPLGSHAITLSGAPHQVMLQTSDGKKFTASNPESLLAEQLGWEIPISNLYYWVRGLPVPNMAAEKQFDSYHHLSFLTQQGWTIRYLRYTSVNQIDVPSKIFLENPALNVKIIINQWQLFH